MEQLIDVDYELVSENTAYMKMKAGAPDIWSKRVMSCFGFLNFLPAASAERAERPGWMADS